MFFACGYVALGENGYFDQRARRVEIRNLESEIQRLGEENERLQQHIHRLRTDPRAIERIAREEMKLARPGEVIYTLPPPAAQPPR